MEKVNKKAAEKYINAYKALIDAAQEITSEWFNHPNEFGEFKVGDIYFREKSKKNDYPNDPKRWYFYITDIAFCQSGNNRRLYDLQIKFSPLDPVQNNISQYIYNLEEEGFKKINYLKGRLPYFGLETGFQITSLSGSLAHLASPYSLVVEGFLIDSPLVLVRLKKEENEGLYLLYPHEINKI